MTAAGHPGRGEAAPPRRFSVRGRVVDRATGRGVSGLKAEAWDKDTRFHDLLGHAVTDARGGFRIEFNELMFGDFGGDELPDLFFRVYRGSHLLTSTEDSVLRNVRDSETSVTIEVDLPRKKPAGRDLIKADVVLRGVQLLRRSDLRGVRKEAGDRASIVREVAGDALKGRVEALRSLRDLRPVRVPRVRSRDVVGQEVETATRRLEQRQVGVNSVRVYQPSVSRDSARLLTRMPVDLKPGQKVDLYQQDGRVRYYALVRETEEPAGRVEGDERVARLDRDLAARSAELETVKGELAQMRESSARKDAELADLRGELLQLQQKQDTLARQLTPERLATLEAVLRERSGGG